MSQVTFPSTHRVFNSSFAQNRDTRVRELWRCVVIFLVAFAPILLSGGAAVFAKGLCDRSVATMGGGFVCVLISLIGIYCINRIEVKILGRGRNFLCP